LPPSCLCFSGEFKGGVPPSLFIAPQRVFHAGLALVIAPRVQRIVVV
jgi:hypothetical protein